MHVIGKKVHGGN